MTSFDWHSYSYIASVPSIPCPQYISTHRVCNPNYVCAYKVYKCMNVEGLQLRLQHSCIYCSRCFLTTSVLLNIMIISLPDKPALPKYPLHNWHTWALHLAIPVIIIMPRDCEAQICQSMYRTQTIWEATAEHIMFLSGSSFRSSPSYLTFVRAKGLSDLLP